MHRDTVMRCIPEHPTSPTPHKFRLNRFQDNINNINFESPIQTCQHQHQIRLKNAHRTGTIRLRCVNCQGFSVLLCGGGSQAQVPFRFIQIRSAALAR